MEKVVHEDGTIIERPVVRDPSRQVVYTRIEPDDPNTSMIMYIRPGWDRMRGFLTRNETAGMYVHCVCVCVCVCVYRDGYGCMYVWSSFVCVVVCIVCT